jgi:CHAT domain-containing protein
VQAMLAQMKNFFAPGTASQAGALRRAQVALMDDQNFSHPYYWAGFSVLGDGEKAMPAR